MTPSFSISSEIYWKYALESAKEAYKDIADIVVTSSEGTFLITITSKGKDYEEAYIFQEFMNYVISIQYE